ncbi:hypothetical protein [Wolbachia endosymbiont of Mansonella perstans]|uniref:hypothetical protein n=1 Tax=Wolbachia endosymbiont of Mansonella perstans TaxID=229526 RepID=UPI001CE18718|nr:hypothetical protein [Wolbachia endosymbiont of Mansonella perstans]MCA4774246.1 hypothetical protein [Wolbachia endosymbiont of Mansonella perstans]
MLKLKFNQGDCIAAIRWISPNAIMSWGEFAIEALKLMPLSIQLSALKLTHNFFFELCNSALGTPIDSTIKSTDTK